MSFLQDMASFSLKSGILCNCFRASIRAKTLVSLSSSSSSISCSMSWGDKSCCLCVSPLLETSSTALIEGIDCFCRRADIRSLIPTRCVAKGVLISPVSQSTSPKVHHFPLSPCLTGVFGGKNPHLLHACICSFP